jgi:hypothetical protein
MEWEIATQDGGYVNAPKKLQTGTLGEELRLSVNEVPSDGTCYTAPLYQGTIQQLLQCQLTNYTELRLKAQQAIVNKWQ